MLTFLALAHAAPKVITPIAHTAFALDQVLPALHDVFPQPPVPQHLARAPALAPAPVTGQLQDQAAATTATKQSVPTWKQAPNAITLAGYALGLWWCVGGPTWAGIVSILADELDGRLARTMGATSELGSILDSTADVALVPMSLLRFGRATSLGALPLLAAPPILLNQAQTRADGWRPPIGSWRAAIMVSAMLLEGLGSLRRTKV